MPIVDFDFDVSVDSIQSLTWKSNSTFGAFSDSSFDENFEAWIMFGLPQVSNCKP